MAASHEPIDWPEPPARPIRYRQIDRIQDAYQGRRDGRHGLPRVIDLRKPVGAVTKEQSDDGDEELPEPWSHDNGNESDAANVSQTVEDPADQPEFEVVHTVTPHQTKLLAIARELAASEQLAWLQAIAPVHRQLAQVLGEKQSLAEQVELARRDLDQIGDKPGEEDLKERRVAEQDREKRPDRLIRERRLAEFNKRRMNAEGRYNGLLARQSTVDQAAQNCELDLERRRAIAQTRSQRVVEHYTRRTATYWQQLIRVHEYGKFLNEALPQISPELPDWITQPLQLPGQTTGAEGEIGSQQAAPDSQPAQPGP